MSETLTNGVIVPDKGSRDWYADLRSNWLKLDSLMAGGNITINPAQTEGVLVATITVGGKEYKLYQQDGDVSVKIDPSAENAEYPLVASTSAEANTGSVVMAPAVTVNPSTGAVTATTFNGNLVAKQINNSDSSSILRIFGGTAASTGANLDLYGENESDSGGGFHIRARNSSGFKALTGKVDGSLSWGGANVLTDNNQIMVLKNLTGNDITSGAVIDCGTGNGLLAGWFMDAAGIWVLAYTKPTGKWKSSNNFSLLAEESGMFIKIG